LPYILHSPQIPAPICAYESSPSSAAQRLTLYFGNSRTNKGLLFPLYILVGSSFLWIVSISYLDDWMAKGQRAEGNVPSESSDTTSLHIRECHGIPCDIP
jgi:hypothetical protein